MLTLIISAVIGAIVGVAMSAITPAPEGQKNYVGSAFYGGVGGVFVGFIIQGVLSLILS